LGLVSPDSLERANPQNTNYSAGVGCESLGLQKIIIPTP
jgi:hypothetical protein